MNALIIFKKYCTGSREANVIFSFGKYVSLALLTISASLTLRSQDVRIAYEKNDTLTRSLAQELGHYLEQATKKSVSYTDRGGSSSDGSISLVVKPGFQNSLKKEGFSIKGNGKSIAITANHFNGLKNGVYYYLNSLGFRFYLPGDVWTRVPSVSSPFIKLDADIYPSFAIRSMFPTGGFRKNLALDPGDAFQKDWDHWLSENMYSSEERIDGHMGEIFNTKHKKELLADTTMLAQVNGQRKWSPSAKWCISNQKFVDLFVQDRVEAFQKMKERSPDRNWISVEPADGYGDCECDNCRKMGTVSDRDFYLANKAAEAIEQKWPGGGVSLFAYNTHAAVPQTAPRSNVFVLVIPYRFQNVTEPSVLLDKWSKKSNNIGVYDYWGTSDASYDLPMFSYLRLVPGKYKLWDDLKIKGFLLESGYSKFNNALTYYFLSRMIWFHETDIDAMLRKFCDENFGKAAPVMFTMLERWGINFKTKFEMPVSFEELKKAYGLENDPTVQRRLDELKAVLTYAAFQNDALDNISKPGGTEKVENMFKYIWSVHNYRIINTGGIQSLMRPKVAGKKDVDNRWTLQDAPKNREFWNDVVQYKAPDPLPESLTNPLGINLQLHVNYPLSDEANIDSIISDNRKFVNKNIVRLSGKFQMKGSVRSSGDGTISLDINITEPIKNPERIPVVVLYDRQGFFLGYKEMKRDQGKQTVQFSDLAKNKRYIFSIFANANFELEMENRLLLLDGTAEGTDDIKILSNQQPALMFAGNYKYYIDPYKLIGQLTGGYNKTIVSKMKSVAKRSALTEYQPGEPFLKITTDKPKPFVLEVINGKTLYGFTDN